MHQLALLKNGYIVCGGDNEISELAKSDKEQAGIPADNGWRPNLLLMSLGNFDEADMLTFAKQVTGT